MLEIRVRYTDKEERDQLVETIKAIYTIRSMSKVYYDREPATTKRVYLEVEEK